MTYTYQLTSGASIRRSDGANIPADPANSDWQAYLAWVAAGNRADPLPSLTTEERVAAAKSARQAAVAAIKVTTSSGKTFDGDETSQERMARAIQMADATGQSSTTWVLADN